MPLKDILERTEKRKAAGTAGVYPQHADRPVQLERKPLPVDDNCAYLGAQLEGGCGPQLFRCDLYPGQTCTRHIRCEKADRHCATCKADTRKTDGVPAELRSVADSVAASATAYPGGEGRCVLTVGGGPYWLGIVVGVRMLRKSGCTLPVQIWYRGSCERVNFDDLDGLGAELIDVESYPEWRARPPLGDQTRMSGSKLIDKDGWRVKSFAIRHTTYETVMYLDADAYCVADPTPLFDLAEARGFVYWEDIFDNAEFWPKVWPAGRGATTTVQGGQLVINRPKFWRELVTADHMNRNAGKFYRHLYGDQDTWRVAMAVTGRAVRSMGKAPWRDPAFVISMNRTPAIVHRCRSKLFAVEDITAEPGHSHGAPHKHLPREAEVFTEFARVLKERDAAKVFGLVYRKGIWGEGSGGGSADEASTPYVDWVNAEIKRNGWESCTDAGCGDGRVARRLRFNEYTGIDVVAEVIEANRARNPYRTWIAGDITDPEELRPADALLVKDVLHHWPNELVTAWLRHVIWRAHWKTIVVCVDCEGAADDADCPLGSYRPLSPDTRPLSEFGFVVRKRFANKIILSRST